MGIAKSQDLKDSGGSPLDNNLHERRPQQKRSIETRARILKSVEYLLEKDAYSEATVQDIISAANCSVGAFYGRFKDKDAALLSIYNARCSSLEKETIAVLSPQVDLAGTPDTLASELRAFIVIVIKHTLRHKSTIRAGLVAPAASNVALFTARARSMNTKLIEQMSTFLQSHAASITHSQPDRAALYVVAVIGGLIRDGLTSSVQLSERTPSLDEFVDEIEKMIFGYLGLDKN